MVMNVLVVVNLLSVHPLPLLPDVILNMISLEYDDTLAAASGAPLEEHLEKSSKKSR